MKEQTDGRGRSVLITGCDGFIGSHLAELMLEKGFNVYATILKSDENISHIKGKINILKMDMTKKADLEAAVEKSQADVIFHMAAQSYVLPSWSDMEGTFEVNVLGTVRLFDAARKGGRNPIIIFASSSAGYGMTNESELPIKENKEFKPSSPYAVSKISADMFCYLYWRAYGMKIVRARIFNTVGPRKRGNVIADFAQMIAEAEKGARQKISVGNLEPVLDFTDVRDTSNALWTLAEKGTYGEAYNVCSSNGHKIKDVLDIMISFANKDIAVEVDPAKFRPADDPIFIGDNTKLRNLGWEPEISIEQSLKDTLDYWRKMV